MGGGLTCKESDEARMGLLGSGGSDEASGAYSAATVAA